jgi:hypothetical protein
MCKIIRDTRRTRRMVVRALDRNGPANDWMRSRKDGLAGGARKAMKNGESVAAATEGDEGVTMIAGRGDFSVARGRDKSRGAGISV